LYVNYVTIALSRGLLGVLAAVSIFTDPWRDPWVTLGLAAFLWNLGGSPSKDFADVPGDKVMGVRTLPMAWEPGDAGWLMFTPMAIAAMLVFVLGFLGLGAWFVLASVVMLGLAGFIVHNVAHGGGRQNRILENGRIWLAYYAGFGVLGLAGWLTGIGLLK
jgi:4-hydroxybenzoate polyprenyltransferase